jgi:hypothetical protein
MLGMKRHMTLTREAAIAIINEAIEKIARLRETTPHSVEHVAFIQTAGLHLARIFGADSTVSRNFSSITYQSSVSYITYAHSIERDRARRAKGAYLRDLGVAEGVLQSARELLLRSDANEILRASRVKAEGATVFISHGKESPALTKIERFVRSCGCQPVLVIREASEGMAIDDLVEKRMGECDCAIILATGDDLVGDRRQPRPNVIHEIGLAQEKFDNRIVYLKEVGCEFPSNVAPKVWENFTRDNLESAFEKILKELRAFDLV